MSEYTSNRSFVVKYAPTTLSEYVYPDEHVKSEIQSYIAGATLLPLLLYGPYGTGKSTLADLLPEAVVEDLNPNLEHRKITANRRKDIATKIQEIEEFLSMTAFNSAHIRVLWIDEADNLDKGIQLSLKGLIDDYLKSTLFIFTTNDVHSIDGGIRSRSNNLSIGKAQPMRWLPRMKLILAAENVPIPRDEQLLKIAETSNGDVRKLMGTLQQLTRRIRSRPQGSSVNLLFSPTSTMPSAPMSIEKRPDQE